MHVVITNHAVGIVEVTPRDTDEKPTAYVYSCGIHGNETAPIEIVNEMLVDIESGVLEIKNPLLIIFGNIKAMREGKQGIMFKIT